jgi:hypothetical protein
MEYRLKIVQDIDLQFSTRPLYWYALEGKSKSNVWFTLKVEYVMLNMVRYLKSAGLDYMTIPLTIIRFYEQQKG